MLNTNRHAEEHIVFRLPYNNGELSFEQLRKYHPLFVEEMDATFPDACFDYFYERNPVSGVYSFRSDWHEGLVAEYLGMDPTVSSDGESKEDKAQRTQMEARKKAPRKSNTEDDLYTLPWSKIVISKRFFRTKHPHFMKSFSGMNLEQALDLFYHKSAESCRLYTFRNTEAEQDVYEILFPERTVPTTLAISGPDALNPAIFVSIETTGRPNMLHEWPMPEDTEKYNSARLTTLAWQYCQKHPNGDYIAVEENNSQIDPSNPETTKEVLYKFLSVLVAAREVIAHEVDFVQRVLLSECVRTGQTDIAEAIRSISWVCTQATIGRNMFARLTKYNWKKTTIEDIFEIIMSRKMPLFSTSLDKCEALVDCVNLIVFYPNRLVDTLS